MAADAGFRKDFYGALLVCGEAGCTVDAAVAALTD
jgi:hypothetical protein